MKEMEYKSMSKNKNIDAQTKNPSSVMEQSFKQNDC